MVDRMALATDTDHVLDAAVRVLSRDPAAGMGAIADAAGISRATLHRRFAGRNELEFALIRRAIGQMRSMTTEIDAAGLVGRAAIEAFLRGALPIAQSMAFVFATTSPEDPRFESDTEQFRQRWIAWIEEGQRRGEIRVDLTASWIVEAMHALGMAAVQGVISGVIAPRDAERLVLTSLLDGITNRPACTTAHS
jgi:TetR/AcrR family transcriptional regulator, mexCD-oprJ operon repressor